jgi:hypothetical protein
MSKRETILVRRKFRKRENELLPELHKHAAKLVGAKPSAIEAFVEEDGIVERSDGTQLVVHVIRIYAPMGE